jgi:hypothetical protein
VAPSWNLFDNWHNDASMTNTQFSPDGGWNRVSQVAARMDAVEAKMDASLNVDRRFDKLERAMLEARFDKRRARFDKLEDKFGVQASMLDPPGRPHRADVRSRQCPSCRDQWLRARSFKPLCDIQRNSWRIEKELAG